jgi:UPF0716 protein FxsA
VIALLFLLFILVPIAEIYVIIQVGQAIGALWTVLILVADSIIGARLVSWQGRRAWRKFQDALAAGRMPHREVIDGVLIVLGGALLLTPGFLTDILGLVLLIPASRAIVRHMLVRGMMRPGRTRWARVVVRPAGGAGRPAPPRPTAEPVPPREPPPGHELPPG